MPPSSSFRKSTMFFSTSLSISVICFSIIGSGIVVLTFLIHFSAGKTLFKVFAIFSVKVFSLAKS